MPKLQPDYSADKCYPVKVSKKNVVDALIEDPGGALSTNIMTVLEQRLTKHEPNLFYFEVDYDTSQKTSVAFCEVFDETYTDIVTINLWYNTL